MKKSLLFLSAVSMFAVNAAADAPSEMYDQDVVGISSNGRWTAADISEGAVVITDRETGEEWVYYGDGGLRYYDISPRKAVSDNGIVVGSTSTSNGAYWENGVWTVLKTPNPQWIMNAKSITPDGSVICGGIGGDEFSVYAENIMLLPAIWHRLPQGGYGDPVALPHPELDLTGRVPQYVTAITISDDGKTVAGQIRDYYGLKMEPVIYKCDDAGNWTYTRPAQDLLNPRNIKFPHWPGELGDEYMMPVQEQYMTDAQIEAFTLAYQNYIYGGYQGREPQYEDFMTPEAIEAYNKAYKEYMDVYVPWEREFNAFMESYYDYADSGAQFVFNSGLLSPDGKYYVSNANIAGRGNALVIIDTETGEYSIFNGNRSVQFDYITADYSILGHTGALGSDTGSPQGYIFPQMQTQAVAIEDYIAQKNSFLGQWMEDNLVHEVIMGLGSTSIYDTREMLCTGALAGTPDLTYIVFRNSTWSWDDWTGPMGSISYVLPMDWDGVEESGVEEITESAPAAISVENGGLIRVEGDYATLDIYDIAGTKVFSALNPKGSVATGLSGGLYIIKAATASGDSQTLKVRIR